MLSSAFVKMLTNLSLGARIALFILILTLTTISCVVAGFVIYRFVLQPSSPAVIPTQEVLDDAAPPLNLGTTISAPGIPDLAASSDSGTSNTDNITNNNIPQFTGLCRNGDNISLSSSLAGVLDHAQTICSGSNYTITLRSALGDGFHSISATATDPTGNTSIPSKALNVTIDTVPPVAPSAPDLVGASDTGSSNTDNITSDITPQFTGTCTPGDTITIHSSVDGDQIPSQICSAGSYDITLTSNLSEVTHSISAVATDAAGNSSTSQPVVVIVETVAPNAPGAPDLAEGSDTGISNVDNITNDTTPQFTGICNTGDIISIHSSSDGNLLPEVTCAEGRYDITLTSTLSEVSHSITARARDNAGNTSSSLGLIVIVDTTPPPAPGVPDLAEVSDTGSSNSDNITSNKNPKFTGTCTHGDTLMLHSSILGNLTPVGDCISGSFEITLSSQLSDGTHTITATETDIAGNVSPVSGGLNVTVDTSEPSAPGTPNLTAGSDSGRSNSDDITNDTNPRFTGTCSDGDRISLTSSAGGILSPSNMACSGGNYDIVVSSLLGEVVHSIYAQATDTAGNTGPASASLSVTIDTLAPSAPGTPDLAPGSDTGSSDSDNITDDNTPQFTGTCASGDEINLISSVDGVLSPSDAICSGDSYDITVTSPLSNGTHSITAIAIDTAGNVSSESGGLSVTIEAAPSAPGAPDLAAGSDTGSSDSDNITRATSPQFTGTCSDGRKINLSSSVDGALNPSDTVCSGGSYDITLTSTLTEATHNITATATDAGGLTSPASGALSVVVDATAPAVPGEPDLAASSDTGSSNTDDTTGDTTPQFTGSCETDAAVTLASSVDGDLSPSGTCSGGAYDINLTSVLSESVHDITAVQVDVAGNSSGSSSALSVSIVIPTLTISVSGNVGSDAVTSTGGSPVDGPIDCPATRCDVDFLLDDNVPLNVNVDASSSFVGWGGDCSAFGTSLTGDLTMDADKTCSATFAMTEAEMDVEGNATSIADGDDTPDSADHTDFGDVSVGSTFDRTFTIQNEGSGTLNFTDFPDAVTLSGSSDYSVQAQPGSGLIASGAADLTFVVRCSPTGAGARTATVSIANNDSDENPYNFDLSCSGIAPEIDVQRPVATSIADGGADDLGDQSTGDVNLQYTLDNSAGTDQLSVSDVTADNLSNVSNFELSSATPITVAAGETATFEISFDVDAAGAFSLEIDILNNDSDENPYDILITGTGATISEMNVLGNDKIIFSGDTTPDTGDHTDFGDVDADGATVTRTFIIQNPGTADLTLPDTPIVTIGGVRAADFTLAADATTPVAAGGQTSFKIIFNPSDTGLRQATISIANNDGDENPYTFDIQGTGTDPAPEMDVLGNGVSIPSGDASPDAADHTDFGDVDVDGGSVTLTFTIRNTGSVNLNLTDIPIVTVAGDHAADFALTVDATTPVSSGGGETTFQITFDPSDTGLREATISIANDDGDENPYTFSIQGTGVTP